MSIEYIVQVPKRYNSCKWNGMRVRITEDDGAYVITVNQKGKKLRLYKKWLISVIESI